MHRQGSSLYDFSTWWSLELYVFECTFRNWTCLEGTDRRELGFRKPCYVRNEGTRNWNMKKLWVTLIAVRK